MSGSRTIYLRVAYEGGAYSGWQIQSRVPTVQGLLTLALAQMDPAAPKLYGASRTDAGVHSRGQVAHFVTPTTAIPVRGYRLGLNGHLPDDVAVLESREMPAGFHSRHSSRGKDYRYLIWNDETRHPLFSRRALHRRSPLDLEAMNAAAAHLQGQHDFQSFRAADCDREHARRYLWKVAVSRDPAEPRIVRIDVSGTAFLKHMVRIIVGSLLEVGRARRPADWIAEIRDACDRRAAGPTVPARGLCLQRVYYPELGDSFPIPPS